MSNKVSDIRFSFNIASGGTTTRTFTLQSAGREMCIKSIFWDIIAWDPAYPIGDTYLPWEQMRDQIILLIVGQTGDNMAYAFTNITGGAAASTGERFVISRPGQLIFNSFFIKNEISFALTAMNRTAKAMAYDINVVVETEEKTMFIE